MELFNLGIAMEQPQCEPPEELDAESTENLVKEANDFAFDEFKKHFLQDMGGDPMLMPVLISSLAHDYVKVAYNLYEEEFKAAVFAHRIHENL